MMDTINKFLDTKLKSSFVGIIILVAGIILTISILLGTILLSAAGIGSGLSPFALIPLIMLATTALIIAGYSIYVGIRYIKSKPFKVNKPIGTILIYLGVLYFAYTVFTYIISNLTGNSGGEITPIFALIWALISVPAGLALRNGCR